MRWWLRGALRGSRLLLLLLWLGLRLRWWLLLRLRLRRLLLNGSLLLRSNHIIRRHRRHILRICLRRGRWEGWS